MPFDEAGFTRIETLFVFYVPLTLLYKKKNIEFKQKNIIIFTWFQGYECFFKRILVKNKTLRARSAIFYAIYIREIAIVVYHPSASAPKVNKNRGVFD